MIKLICSDIDGTLAKEGADSLHPEYYEVIKKLKNRGVRFAAASGRPISSMKYIFQPVDDDIIYIAESGSLVLKKKEVLADGALDYNDGLDILRRCKDMTGYGVYVSGKKCGYVERQYKEIKNRLIKEYRCEIQVVDNLLTDIKDDIIEIELYHPESGEGAVTEEFKKYMEQHERVRAVCAGKEWFNCMSRFVNKGTAVAALQKRYGIEKEETMVFGDNLNDIEMLHQAKWSFAVANAREEVKHAAKQVAASYAEDGVLQEMKKVLEDYEKKNTVVYQKDEKKKSRVS